jgi:hypothetical protein
MRLPLGIAAIALALLAPAWAGSEFDIPDRDSGALAAAIAAANRSTVPQRIRLAPGGLYTFDGAQHPVALPAITGRIEIDGRGAEIRRYGRGPLTLLEVDAGGSLLLRDLTLAEGNHGALRNRGSLRLDSVRVLDSDGEGLRAVVLNHGRLEAVDSEFAFNRVDGAGRDAGTVVNHGELHLLRTRFEGNRLSRRWPSLAAAAAVLNHGSLHVDGVEFVANGIDDGFGGLGADAVLNLDGGRVSGPLPAGALVEEVPLVAQRPRGGGVR